MPLPAREVSPSMLLAAPFAVVPWHSAGRAEIMATLDAWADDTTQLVAVRLLHAPGGAGKTRLAMEWLRRRRDRGDTAGFLPVAAKDDWVARACQSGAPVVAAIDYAETRADLLAVLGAVAAMAAAPKPPRVHVLLLARSDGDWWDALLERELALKALLSAQAPIALRPLAMGAVERQAVFDEALAAFARYRRRPVPRAQIAAADPRFDRVLYLHMAALAAVERTADPADAASAEAAVVLDAGALMDETLDHEQRFWLRDRRGRNQATLSLARQIVAAATLRGGISHEARAQKLCKRLSGRERTDADDELLILLHDVYAVAEGGPYLPGLQPDLLGEAMVLRIASKDADEKWIERVIVEDDDAAAVDSAFTVLGRAAAVNAAAISPWLATLLRTELAIRALPALRAAMVVGQRTAFSPLGDLLADALERDGTTTMAHALTHERIPFFTVSLRRVVEWRNRIRLADTPAGIEPETLAKRAALLDERGGRLRDLGQREAALGATHEAVEVYRGLAAKHPDAFLPDLATSLSNLGLLLSEVGQRDAALDATHQAVELRRGLAAKHPDAFLPDLAVSLTNLGLLLSEVGQRDAALDATRKAVEAYRGLAAKHPDAFLPNLAKSLNNLGADLSAIGQREAALDATRQAIEVYRGLAAKHPDAFLPDLARSLTNLGLLLSEVGQREAALDAAREAVETNRALAAQHPNVFLPDLARSLTNLGILLSEVGQLEASLGVTGQAVEANRALATKLPDAFLPDLATSLNNLGAMLSAVGQREAALDATREAVKLRSELATKHPDAFLPNLATSLNNLGVMLSAVGQREAALDATRQAVEFSRALAAKHPDAFLPDLATNLENLALRLTETGDNDAANAASREAAEIRRMLQAKNPRPDGEGGSA